MDREELNKKFSVTEEQLDSWAAEYENETWTGGLGKVTLGRPRLYGEDLETVSFRLPKTRISAIELVAQKAGMSKSEFFREAVDRALIAHS